MSSACMNVVVRRSNKTVTKFVSKRCLSAAAARTSRLNAPVAAAAVVPATNGGLALWSSSDTSSAKDRTQFKSTTTRPPFSSLAATAEEPAVTVDERILASSQDLLDTVDMEALTELASQACTPLRLLDMYRYASSRQDQRLRNAQFLHHELPIRVAQRAVDLLTLPYGLNQTRHIRHVAKIYLNYLEKFHNTPCPTNFEEETAFTDMLQSLVLDRTAIPTEIARGIRNWKSLQREDRQDLHELEDALYRFFTARVGLRFLCEHHILSSRKRHDKRHDLLGKHSSSFSEPNDAEVALGCIQTNCDVVQEISHVISQVTQQTKDCYGMCPKIELLDCSSKSTKNKNFTYVPHHLQYMVSELLKNSSRATVQRHLALSMKNGKMHEPMPPIRVVVAKGAEDVTIKIADRGGGVPRSKLQHIWSFAHSTADNEEESKTDFGQNAFTGGATHGFGLPLSKIYAQYFGGELTLKSMEGYGTDAYLYLPRLGEACENLPQRVIVSPGAQDSNPTAREETQAAATTNGNSSNGANGVRRYSSSSQRQT